MAAYSKRNGGWRVQVRRKGISKSASFATKAEAVAWATKTEADILAGKRGDVPDKPFSELLERYRDEVSTTKRGERWERLRIGLICRDPIAKVKLPELNATHIAQWRNRRLTEVSAASVRREWTLLSHACNIAVKEWKWLTENPFAEVKRPDKPADRDRRITQDEIDRLLLALGYDYEATPETVTARAAAAMLFAIETGMRAGEICRLVPADIKGSVARVRESKTATGVRNVPLSPEALRLIAQMPAGETVFGITSGQLDALFRKGKARAMIEDLHFHDTRAEAITRLAKKLDIISLARMVGHRDLRMLQIYYRESAEDIAKRL